MTTLLPQGELTIERMCALAGVSRAGYYRHWTASAPRQEETCVRDAIQRVALATGFTATDASPRAAARRYGREPQARIAPDARGQSAVSEEAGVRAGDDRLPSRLARRIEPGARHGAHRHRPAVGGGYHVHPPAGRVRVLGRGSRCLQPARHRLGFGKASAGKPCNGRARPWRSRRVDPSLGA